MLLFSNIKNYDLRINNYFVSTDIMHQTSNIYLYNPDRVYTLYNLLLRVNMVCNENDNENYNYLLDLPDTVYESIFKLHMFGYHKNGKLHRENGPAKVTIYENGHLKYNEDNI